MRPFRFGVQLSGAPSGTAWRAVARKLEDLGYATLFIPDHFGDQWAPLVALTVAAEATTVLRVGSLVFDNDYRHPAALAKEVATLDLVSEGRVELGLGAGWMRSDYDQLGIAYDRPGVRIERMVEGLHIMKDLWSEGCSSRSGRHYRLDGAQGLPRPVSRPHPPIIIGGGGRRVLSVAAAEADIVGFNPSMADGVGGPAAAASAKAECFDERVAWVQEVAGDRIHQLELQVLTQAVAVVPDRDAFFARAGPGFDMSAAELAEVPLALVGTVEQIVETLRARRERYGFSYWVVHEADIEPFAPVVAALAGR